MSQLNTAAKISAAPQYGTFLDGPINSATTGWYQTLVPYPKGIPADCQFPTYDQISTMILNIEANSVTALAAALAAYGVASLPTDCITFPISVQTSYHALPQTYNLYLAPA
jgi:hypothetical protein